MIRLWKLLRSLRVLKKAWPNKNADEERVTEMKKTVLITLLFVFGLMTSKAQGYDIKINLKGCKDTLAYLGRYLFDQTYIADTCKLIKSGRIEFKGNKELDKGIYILVNQEKTLYFEFLVNESQKITINGDISNMSGTLESPGNIENQQFFSLAKFNSIKNTEYDKAKQSTTGKSKEDSIKFMRETVVGLEADVKKFDDDFNVKTKGSFLNDFLNLKKEKVATDIPKASNGRPDSIYQYYYYKSHYFDGVDFKDERLARTPYFDDRIKTYFESVIVNNPDTVIQEIDKLLARCNEGNLNYNVMIGYFTYKYEQSKVVGFDKVFLHMIGAYVIPGKADKVYSAETTKALKKAYEVQFPLMEGKKLPDLFMIDTVDAPRVRKMGFDTAKSAESVTELYYRNQAALTPLFKTLYGVNAKYTVLLFWAADCGHCQKEVPKLHETLKELKGKIDVKVFAVQTKDEQYNEWRHFLIDKKITDFINVYDPVHINNVKEKFDMVATPLIYIVDKDKKIIAKKLAAEHAAELLKAYDKQDKKP